MRRIEKKGHELRRKILLPSNIPQPSVFSPMILKHGREQAADGTLQNLACLQVETWLARFLFLFLFLQGREILENLTIRDRTRARVDRR